MRALLVEDDAALGKALKKGLELNGYSCEWVLSGQDALHAALQGEFDLCILDINLPDQSGIKVLQALRRDERSKQLPIMLLTAIDRLDQKVTGLDAGADDYLTKPFELAELLARLRVLLRRTHNQRDNILRCKTMELDLTSRTLTLTADGKAYVPTGNEFKLLSLLMRRPGQMIGKARIEEELHGWDGEAESNNVEVTVYNLRRKLGKEIIVTMRGVGYMVMA